MLNTMLQMELTISSLWNLVPSQIRYFVYYGRGDPRMTLPGSVLHWEAELESIAFDKGCVCISSISIPSTPNGLAGLACVALT